MVQLVQELKDGDLIEMSEEEARALGLLPETSEDSLGNSAQADTETTI